MSTLWTPDGEVQPSGEEATSDEEAMAQLDELRTQLLGTDPTVVIANHCYGLFELAAVYLSAQPPRLGEAQLTIDALGLLVDGLGDRLGGLETELLDALAQLRLAYVELHTLATAAAPAAEEPEA